MHHDAVAKLEDLEREDCAGEENKRKRKQREFSYVVRVGRVGVVFLWERRRRATEKRSRVTAARVVENIQMRRRWSRCRGLKDFRV